MQLIYGAHRRWLEAETAAAAHCLHTTSMVLSRLQTIEKNVRGTLMRLECSELQCGNVAEEGAVL